MTYEKTEDFYIQKIYLTNIRAPRFEFIANICRGKKVLHIGCADAMVFKAESNLHIYLSKLENTTVEGLDINVEAINTLAGVCPGTYYTSYDQVQSNYDMVIVPEVMEHVPDVNLFLKSIFAIPSDEYLITVPSMDPAQIFCTDTYCLEQVHPDHKYWFSPYTLYNVISPFLEEHRVRMYYLENKTQVGVRLKKKQPEPEPEQQEKINDLGPENADISTQDDKQEAL